MPKQVSFMTSQHETSRKNKICSTGLSTGLPAREKIIGTTDILHHEVKVVWDYRSLFIPCKFGYVDHYP